MATYAVILDGLTGYGVEVQRTNGFQSRRGFKSHVEAMLWIADCQKEDKRNGLVEASESSVARQKAVLARAKARRIPINAGLGHELLENMEVALDLAKRYRDRLARTPKERFDQRMLVATYAITEA